jgi:ribosomal protein L21E
MPEPSNVKQLRQFLSLAGYFRRFIQNFAILAEPLTRLLRKNVPWDFGQEQLVALNQIKDLLTNRPILKIFNPNWRTEVHTDASKVGVAGILFQINDTTDKRHVIAYFSRQTTNAERHYHSYQLETLAVVEAFRYFRVYLVGIQFTLITDCTAIRSTAEKKDLLPRVARWWMELQDYNFDIQYRPGLKMNHVDCLSRNPSTSIMSVINITESEWLLATQLQDETVCTIRDILLAKCNKSAYKHIFALYTLKDGLVYRKCENGLIKWLVPKVNRWQICRLCHDEMGHFGVDKTLAKIQENYYFPRMRRFVTKYVKACLHCLYYKNPSGRKPGQLHPIEKKNGTILCFTHGPCGSIYSCSKRQNAQVLVMVDGFTKFCIIEAVKSTKTRHVLKALKQLFDIFGVPDRVITDRGTAFTSRSFQTSCEAHGIRHILNAVATPRANGQCERYNRTIISSLAALNGGSEDDSWDDHVKTVQRGLNMTISQATGVTPSELLFGTKLRSVPEGILLSELQTDINRLSLPEIREKAKARLDSGQNKQKQRFDAKRAKAPMYAVGKLVLVQITSTPSTGESKKLHPKFRGPYRVVAVLPNERYEVEDLPGKRKQKTVVAVDHIKPWITLKEP